MEWSIDLGGLFHRKRFKDIEKKHSLEHASCLRNLFQVLEFLNAGKCIQEVSYGFFRSEGCGVYRIGQTGVKAGKETRLYVFPNEEEKIMHVLCIGLKETQKNDIAECHKVAKTLRKGEGR
jgi:putative component of toxin-antitoxin plasmid stabilization module